MNSIEISGKTIDEAIFNGIDKMGLSIDEVDIEIVDEGGSRFLGIGRKPAIVKLTERKKEEVEKQRVEEKQAFEQEKKITKEPRKAAPKQRQRKQVSRDKTKRSRGGRKQQVEQRALDTPTELGQEGEFLQEMLLKMGLDDAIVSAYQEEDDITLLNVTGSSMGIIIGRRGETLNAIQYLCSLIGNKEGEDYRRVVVDTENYRKKREQVLSRLAKRKAQAAIHSGRAVSMEPMNPYERRIMHATLQQVPGVSTQSEGEEPNRYVVIEPDVRKN